MAELSGGTDTNLDGRTSIEPNPNVVVDPALAQTQGLTDTDINARVTAEVDRQITTVNERHATELSELRQDNERASAIACLQGYIDGNPGDTLDAVQLRAGVQDLILQIHNGPGDKPLAEFLTDAAKLNEGRLQILTARGGDGSQMLPDVRRPNNETDGLFDMGMFMSGLGGELIRLGDTFDPEKMTGAPELEFASEMLSKNDTAKRQYSAAMSDVGPRGAVIPFPLAGLRPDIVFANNYGTDAATLRRQTYRRDALVDYFRPSNVLQMLGVPMPMISNDITLPRLTDSLQAAWLAENTAITEDALVVGNINTTPKRLGVRDSISWMLLAAGDQQFGIQPVVTQEMARAVMQQKESAVYNGSGSSNQPTGIRSTTNVGALDVGTTAPTYRNLLSQVTAISNADIPVDAARYVTNPNMRELLSSTQRFATGSASLLNDVAFREMGSGPGDIGSFGGTMGSIGGHPCAITTHIPTQTGGDTYVICGIWMYVWCLDYSVAFLVIDDISQAATGQTRITVNSFHDVAVRLPTAFHVLTYDTTI